MVSFPILKFAKENGFKTNGKAVFGFYKKQLVAIGMGLDGASYYISCATKRPLKDHKSKFKNSEVLKKSKVQKVPLFSENSVVWTLHMALRKNKDQRLLDALDAIVEELGKYQEYNDLGEVVLYNGVVKFKKELSESDLMASKPQADPDRLLGVLGALGVTLLVGFVLGAVQYLLTTKAHSSWNPLFVGLIISQLAGLSYIKLSGKLDTLIRVLLVPLCVVGYVTYFGTFCYYYLTMEGFDVQLPMVLDRIFHELSSRPIYHAMALIFGFVNAFFLKFNGNKGTVEVGEGITDENYQNIGEHQKGDRASILFFLFSLIYLFAGWMSALLREGVLDGLGNMVPLLIYCSVLHICLVGLAYYLAGKHKSIKLTLTHLGTKPVGSFGQFIVTNFLVFMLSLGNLGFLVFINSELDRSDSQSHTTSVFNGRAVGRGKGRDFCYDIKHWEKEKSFSFIRFCRNKHGNLREDEVVEIKVKKGFLGAAWVTEAELPRFKGLKTFLASLEREDQLRNTESQHFFSKTEKEERVFVLSKVREWEESCKQKGDYTCRLRSYFSEYEKDEESRKSFLDRGCDGEDLTACYGLYLMPESTEEQKDKYLRLLNEKCELKEWKQCRVLGNTLWGSDYNKNYDRILGIYKKACEEGQDKASCANLKKLKDFPVKEKKK